MVRQSSTVPRPLDSFIGRAEERQTVQTLLATHRFVTLTGPAGVGKTRLALRIAEELVPSYPDGVGFVELVELADAARVPQAVAAGAAAPVRILLQSPQPPSLPYALTLLLNGLAALHGRAAAWYETEGMAAEAIEHALAGKLLAGTAGVTTLRAVPPASPPSVARPGDSSPALIEPLSDRELEVLRLVAAGLPNKEIAAHLFLAVGTVKRHLNNLNGKLDVTSRTSAVARARDLGLL
jgi:ATP/maltotriose-dependent transcriptional regulator MalT